MGDKFYWKLTSPRSQTVCDFGHVSAMDGPQVASQIPLKPTSDVCPKLRDAAQGGKIATAALGKNEKSLL